MHYVSVKFIEYRATRPGSFGLNQVKIAFPADKARVPVITAPKIEGYQLSE